MLYDDGRRVLPPVPGIAGKPMTRNASIGHSPNRTSPKAKQAALRQTSAKAYGAKPFAGRPDEYAGRPKGGAKVECWIVGGKRIRVNVG